MRPRLERVFSKQSCICNCYIVCYSSHTAEVTPCCTPRCHTHDILFAQAGGAHQGVKGVHDSVTLGDGACRVLPLLFQQDAQMPLKSSLHHADYEALCLRERERFRKVAMNVFGGNEALIPSPVRKDPSGRYVTLPESFGDLLCESAQYIAEPRFGIMFRPWPSRSSAF